jgi:hypothetical protein
MSQSHHPVTNLQVRSSSDQLLHNDEEEVSVDVPLMHLIDEEMRNISQIVLKSSQQDPSGHEHQTSCSTLFGF